MSRFSFDSESISLEGYEKGVFLLRSGKLGEALVVIDSVILADPTDVRSRLARAEVFTKLGRYREALTDIDEIIKIEPDKQEHLLSKISLLGIVGQRGDFLSACKSFLALNPHDNHISSLIHLMVKNRAVEDALKLLEVFIAQNPENTKLYEEKAAIYLFVAQERDALDFVDHALSKFPENNSLKYSKINLLLKYKNPEVVTYIDVNFKDNLLLKVDALEKLERYEEAIDLLSEEISKIVSKIKDYISRSSDSEQEDDDIDFEIDDILFIKKSDILFKLGRVSDALECINLGLNCCPEDREWLFYTKIGLLAHQNKFEEALKVWDELESEEDSDEESDNLLQKAKLYEHFNQNEKALKCYESMDKEESVSVHKGILFIKMGKYSAALQCFEEYLAMDPQNSIVLFYKGLSLDKLNEREAALDSYEKSIQAARQNYLPYLGKGNILMAQGNEKEALHFFNEAYRITESIQFNTSGLGKDTKTWIDGIFSTRKELLGKYIELHRKYAQAKSDGVAVDEDQMLQIDNLVGEFLIRADFSQKIESSPFELLLTRNSLLAEEPQLKELLASMISQIDMLAEQNRILNLKQKRTEEKFLQIDKKLDEVESSFSTLEKKIQAAGKGSDEMKSILHEIKFTVSKVDPILIAEINAKVIALSATSRLTRGQLLDLQDEINEIMLSKETEDKSCAVAVEISSGDGAATLEPNLMGTGFHHDSDS